MNRIRKTMVAALFIFAFATFVQGYNWSAAGTFRLPAASGWHRYTTAGRMLSAIKSTDSTKFDVDTYERSARSAPVFRLVNSDNEVRSDSVNCPQEGERATGSNNSGTIGYRYYASVRPAYHQVGTDTIKLDFTPR